MDYEKKYNEALKEIRELISLLKKNDVITDNGIIESNLQRIFPELAESEDERIRKWLYDYFKTIGSTSWLHEKDMPHEQILAYLEKQKENIEKEYVFRPLVGTDITIAAEQAIRRAMEGDHLVLAFNGWYVPVDKYATTKGLVDSYDTFIEKQKKQKPAGGREYSCPDCGTTSVCTNDESEGDKRYREGVRYALQQTEDYTIGKTFKGLIPCWVNAPSELQPAHKYHGKNVVIMHENNGGFRCVYIDDEKPVTFHLPEDTLFVEGWRKPAERFEEAREKYQVEWSEEDERMLKSTIWHISNSVTNGKNTDCKCDLTEWLKEKLKSLRPSWKPSEQEKGALRTAIHILTDERSFPKAAAHLQNILDAFEGKESRKDWKPSKEQMEALCKASDLLVSDLNSLYNDLKKLI